MPAKARNVKDAEINLPPTLPHIQYVHLLCVNLTRHKPSSAVSCCYLGRAGVCRPDPTGYPREQYFCLSHCNARNCVVCIHAAHSVCSTQRIHVPGTQYDPARAQHMVLPNFLAILVRTSVGPSFSAGTRRPTINTGTTAAVAGTAPHTASRWLFPPPVQNDSTGNTEVQHQRAAGNIKKGLSTLLLYYYFFRVKKMPNEALSQFSVQYKIRVCRMSISLLLLRGGIVNRTKYCS